MESFLRQAVRRNNKTEPRIWALFTEQNRFSLKSVKIRENPCEIRGQFLNSAATFVPTILPLPLAQRQQFHLASVMKADLRVW
jgi:hypothetical protein